MKDLFSKFIVEASRAVGMAARAVSSTGAGMSERAVVGTLRDSVIRLDEFVTEMEAKLESDSADAG